MSTNDEPPPPPRANATIQLDALNADDIELKDRESLRDLGAASGRMKPPPLPPEASLPGPAATAAPPGSPQATRDVGGPQRTRDVGGPKKTALYVVGFVIILGAAIYGGLKVGGVANTAPAPTQSASAAKTVAPPAIAPVETVQPAASTETKTITIPTVEMR